MNATEGPKQRFSVTDAGHGYKLFNAGEDTQPLQFIKKEFDTEGKLVTAIEGTTCEAVLEVLINRMQFLNDKLADAHNLDVIEHLAAALQLLEARTQNRVARGVEGTAAA